MTYLSDEVDDDVGTRNNTANTVNILRAVGDRGDATEISRDLQVSPLHIISTKWNNTLSATGSCRADTQTDTRELGIKGSCAYKGDNLAEINHKKQTHTPCKIDRYVPNNAVT